MNYCFITVFIYKLYDHLIIEFMKCKYYANGTNDSLIVWNVNLQGLKLLNYIVF